MIVRMWEARVAPGAESRVAGHLAPVLGELRTTDGCVGAEAFRSLADQSGEPDDRVVVISRWRDIASLEQAAGPGWRVDSISDEPGLWARPPHVWHFEAWSP